MLKLYNTLSREKEEFVPLEAGKVKMYACGVTVYDLCHLGHARSLITFDMIHRHLKYKGFDVTFVRNFTDIDDKIIDRAKELGMEWQELTAKFIKAFDEDTAALGMVKPTIEPKATEHIPEMIALIQGLEEKGIAYKAGSDVFYSVRKFKEYGKLSGKNIEDLEVGARVDVMDSKKDPLDFALWKGAKPGEPKWDSPWGEGRPGWHIECSVMSMKYLSDSFDIHGGGRDLIFPHHENEIAQSEACSHKPFAKYWMHNGFVNINAEKMSKSLKNFMTIRDILAQIPGEVIRLFVLSAHYRSPLDYTEQNIFNAQSGLERHYQTMVRLQDHIAAGKEGAVEDLSDKIVEFKNDFVAAMDDDFNSAKVVGQVFEWVRLLNKALDGNTLSLKNAQEFLDATKDIHQVLGLFGSDGTGFLAELKEKAVSDMSLGEDEIQALIADRKEARKNKDFARSDEIREQLSELGIVLKDNPDGTTSWTVKS